MDNAAIFMSDELDLQDCEDLNETDENIDSEPINIMEFGNPEPASQEQPNIDTNTDTDTNTNLSTSFIVYTLEEHKAFDNRLDLGQVSAEELKETFERAVSSENSIKTELRKLKVVDLKKRLRGYFCRSEKKEYLVSQAYDKILMMFLVSDSFTYEPFSETYVNALHRHVLTVTDEQIQAQSKKILERRAFLKKALTNPETKEELETFVYYRGESRLSSEQKVKWDEIQAGHSLAKREQEIAQKAVITQADIGNVQFDLVKHFHTNRNHDVFIVTMNERLDKATFEELCKKARQLGGNYSKPWRDKATGSLSPGGFMFNGQEQAQQFMALKEGDVSRLAQVQEHKEEVREAAVERLQETAERLEEKAKESLSQPRLANTIRRAGMAASAEKQANKELALAQTIQNVTEGISEGNLKFLKDIKAKTHFELLEILLIRAKYARGKAKAENWKELNEREIVVEDIEFARYVDPRIDFNLYRSAVEIALKVKGANLLGKRLKKLYFLCDNNSSITFHKTEHIRLIKELIGKLKYSRVVSANHYAEQLSEAFIDYDRLQAMNITDEFVLRSALREYLEYRQANIKSSPVKEMERDLVGRNIPGYFPTPKFVVERMLELINLESEAKVLEPSAGKGNIADEIREKHPGCCLSVIEINESLRNILLAKGHQLIAYNFLKHEDKYSFIVMNPPFEDGQDIEHVRHAYSLLFPVGRLVSIMSEGVFFRNDKKASEFRDWLDSVKGYSEKLPQGSFLNSERSTGVSTRIVFIDKSKVTDVTDNSYGNLTKSLSNQENELDETLSDETLSDETLSDDEKTLSNDENLLESVEKSVDSFVVEKSEAISTQATEIIPTSTEVLTQTPNTPSKSINLSALERTANSLKTKAEKVLSVTRVTNTARKAQMAESVESSARREIRLANTICNLVKAIKEGKTIYLSGVKEKRQIDLIEYILKQAKDNRSSKIREPYKQSEYRQVILEDVDFAEYPSYAQDCEILKQLGINDLSTLITALKEYFDHRSVEPKDDHAKRLEREIVGMKIPNYFPTPKPLIDKMLDLANITEGMNVLEPSAGGGHIADEIKARIPKSNLSVIEINWDLKEILEAKGYNLTCRDFLAHQQQYHRIVMNPPFDKGEDVEHLQHAYSLLFPNGKVVSIMCESSFIKNDKKAKEFREWFESVNGYSQKLPNGSFLSSDRPTNVATRLVVINKPDSMLPTNTLSETTTQILSDSVEDNFLQLEEVKSVDPNVDLKPDSSVDPNVGEVTNTVTLQHTDSNQVSSERRRDGILTVEEYDEIKSDFLKHQESYNSIMMRPILDNGQDLEHVYHAYNLLNPGGHLTTVAPSSMFSSPNRTISNFRKWLKSVDAYCKESYEGIYLILITKNTLF